jgi:hypothetical protein
MDICTRLYPMVVLILVLTIGLVQVLCYEKVKDLWSPVL